ncbi:riboflavin synthase [Hyphomicrobium sp. CS1GBMeth3]|uniref:riboflavin synthase n=1 Tax=Hyphomicrobium sp. CS1GBMeth3 TaxID=1892845 RepID=UPI000931C035|nr:riboflavin synthase [Hyphomicrobium sp. CS1GBMeth3]
MFTGIITDVGEIIGREGGRFAIRSHYDADGIALGASIACDGCCLTVVTVRADGDGSAFTVDVSNETLSKTTLGSWEAGYAVNLERALRAGDELGGHIVSGHVDGVGEIVDMHSDGESVRVLIEVPTELAPFIAPKGSVALNGTSLTVNEVEGLRFGVNLIPATLTQTTWGRKKPGDEVNVEIDLFARYVARIMEFRE